MTSRLVHRPARSTPSVPPPDEQVVQLPPRLPEGDPGLRSLLMLVPLLGAGASMTVMMLFRGSSLAAVGALMMLATVAASVVMALSQRGRASRQRLQERDRYLAYLERRRGRLQELERERVRAARATDPHAQALLSVARDPHRLWERRRDDDDFLVLRLGTGSERVHRFRREGEEHPLQVADDFMLAELDRVERRFATAREVPARVALDAAGTVSVVGDREFVDRVARLLVCQAATTSSPEDVHLALAAPPERLDAWAWLRWLPHLADQDRTGPTGPQRRVAPDVPALVALLQPTLAQRLTVAAQERRDRGAATGARFARLLLVLDEHGRAATPPATGDREVGPAELGLTVLHLVDERGREPEEVQVRISQLPDGRALVEEYPRRDAEPVRREVAPDELGPAQAETLARVLAGLRLSPDSLEHDAQRRSSEATELLGIEDVRALDLDRLWAPRPRTSFLRVPLGTDEQGAPVMLDLKEAAQFGMGPHGLCVGATGSGKSELLRTLVLGLLTTHSPQDVSLVLVDYKGGATFAPFAAAPHVAGVITNLGDDAALVERVYASLAGEVQRRQQVLKDAGSIADITTYRRERERRPELEPLPHLLVVIDEFGELITAKPDFIELFLSIGRIGRSIGVHLLLSSQRIEAGRLRGLETYLSYRIGLRTLSETESRTVLDTPDAFTLPALPGWGYLKVDTTTYTRFRAGYVSGALSSERTEREVDAVPQAVAVPRYAGEEERPEPVAPAAAPEEDGGPTVLATVLGQLARCPRAGAPVWLPPLPDVLTLDEAVERPRATSDGLRVRRSAPLRVPMGLVDDPARQRQEVWELDLAAAGGNVLVVGAPGSGRTTLLQTVAASLAVTHSPQEVVVYALDLLGSGLAALEGLPNVGGVAVRMDREVVRRTVEEVAAVLADRERLFALEGARSLGHARRLAASGEAPGLAQAQLADVVLLVDGVGQVAEELGDLEEQLGSVVRRGGGYGIHVVATAARWSEVRLGLQTFFGTKVELRLGDPGESGVGRVLSQTLTADRPGRCLLAGGLFAQVALPRVDGRADRRDLADGLADLAQRASAATTARAPRVRLLPPVVRPGDLADGGRAGVVPLGLDEADLRTVFLDMTGEDRSLLVLGDPGTGRSNVLRRLVAALVAQLGPDELVFAVVDPRRSLQGVVPEEYLGGYAGSTALAERLVAAVVPELRSRVPQGVEEPAPAARPQPWVVLLVDDYDTVTAGGSSPLDPVRPFVGMAHELNLSVVLTRRVAGAARGVHEPVFAAVRESGATGLLLSGDRSEGQLLGSVRAQTLPTGRALLVRAGQPLRTVQVASEDDQEGGTVQGRGFGR